MTEEEYVQCKFKRPDYDMNWMWTTAWIPAWAACRGNYVQLLSLDRHEWLITEVGAIRKPKSEVMAMTQEARDLEKKLK